MVKAPMQAIAICAAITAAVLGSGGCGGAGTSESTDDPVGAQQPSTEGSEPAPERIDASAYAEARRLFARATWGARPDEVRAAARDLPAARRRLLEATVDGEAFDARFPVALSQSELLAQYPRTPNRQQAMQPDASTHRDLIRIQRERAIVRAIEGAPSFREVATDFWFNHFSVYASKANIRYTLLDYEEAIRSRIMGTFSEMLVVTARHPAMLEYLDNASSVREGFREGRGLNENYARELLELHTLGEGNGYTQADTRETARIFTGWNIQRHDGERRFVFRRRAHDPDEKNVMGQTYAGGEEAGMALLRRLASDERSARRVSLKLAERFLTDSPDETLIAGLVARYGDDGDLRALSEAVLERISEENPPLFKSPFEFVVSAARMVNARVADPAPLRQALGRMRMLPYDQPIPTGYPTGQAWLSASTMLERFKLAEALVGGELGLEFDLQSAVPEATNGDAVIQWAESWVGPLSARTRDVLTPLVGPDQRGQRLMALIASPEFMVR